MLQLKIKEVKKNTHQIHKNVDIVEIKGKEGASCAKEKKQNQS